MAQAGNFTPILLYSSSTTGNTPGAANLTNSANGSEIAINIFDGRLFYKDTGNVVRQIADKLWVGTVTSVGGTGSVNGITLTGTVTSSGNLTLGGTLGNIANSQLTNSTISGVALGANLFNLTAGTGVSFSAGTTYNGSTAITINATGTGGTVTSVAALTLGTTGTDLSSTVANGTTTPIITLNVPTASAANRGALSAADWTTFNSKAPAVTYTSNYIPYGQGTTTPNQSAGLQYNGTTFTTTGISTSNNLAFTGTGNRITGDFGNATVANRVAFQSSTTNGNTTVFAIPNGTGTVAGFFANNDPTLVAASSEGSLSVNGTTDVRLASAIYLGGTYLPLTMYTGGSERLRINTSGNVGIGTSSPNGKLDVRANTNGNLFGYLQNDSTGASAQSNWQINAGGRYANLIANYSGSYFQNAGIGLTTIYQDYDTQIFRANNGTERMRIDSSGNLLVGTTSVVGTDDPKVSINGNSCIATNTATTNLTAAIGFWNPNGRIGYIGVSGTTTSYVTSSDYRLKENITPMTGALDVVAQLKPVTYKWKADGSDGQGFIAHELQAVVPDCVTGEKDAVDGEGKPVYQGIDTSFLVATLTAAIQELKAEIDLIKAQINQGT